MPREEAGNVNSLGSSRLATAARIRIKNSGHQQIAISCGSSLTARRHESNYLDHPVKHSVLPLFVASAETMSSVVDARPAMPFSSLTKDGAHRAMLDRSRCQDIYGRPVHSLRNIPSSRRVSPSATIGLQTFHCQQLSVDVSHSCAPNPSITDGSLKTFSPVYRNGARVNEPCLLAGSGQMLHGRLTSTVGLLQHIMWTLTD